MTVITLRLSLVAHLPLEPKAITSCKSGNYLQIYMHENFSLWNMNDQKPVTFIFHDRETRRHSLLLPEHETQRVCRGFFSLLSTVDWSEAGISGAETSNRFDGASSLHTQTQPDLPAFCLWVKMQAKKHCSLSRATTMSLLFISSDSWAWFLAQYSSLSLVHQLHIMFPKTLLVTASSHSISS